MGIVGRALFESAPCLRSKELREQLPERTACRPELARRTAADDAFGTEPELRTDRRGDDPFAEPAAVPSRGREHR